MHTPNYANLISDAFEAYYLDAPYHTFQQGVAERYQNNIVSLISATLQPTNLLGEGTRSRVYQIPHLAAFVLQIPHGDIETAALPTDTFSIADDAIQPLNFGQTIAVNRSNGMKILLRQKGTTYGINYTALFQRYDINAVLGENQPIAFSALAPYREDYAVHLRRIAAMPLVAFIELAEKIESLATAGYHLDPCSKNILIDSDRQRFNTVDHTEYIGPYTNMAGLAFALLDTMFVDLEQHALDHEHKRLMPLALDKTLTGLRHQVLLKLMKAAKHTGLEVPTIACSKNAFGYFQRSFDLNYALQISGISLQWSVFRALHTSSFEIDN